MPRNVHAIDIFTTHLLRRALVLLGVSIVLGTVTSLAFAAKRIAAEDAAYRGPVAPQCVPSQLNRSALLPGTQLAVSPLPDSLDASYDTQISFLGYPASALSAITVSGSNTGTHTGRLEAYSQGDGASFVPSKPFHAGETVTVHGKLSIDGKTEPFAFHFTTAVPDPLAHRSARADRDGRLLLALAIAGRHLRRALLGAGAGRADDLRKLRQPRVVRSAATGHRVDQPAGANLRRQPGADVVAGLHPAAGLRSGRRGDREHLLPADHEIPGRQRPAGGPARIPHQRQRHGAADVF